jgi:hypothetical protein
MVESRDGRSIYQLCSVTFFLRESALLPFVFLEFFFLAVFVSDVPFDFVSSKYVASSL